MAPTLGLPETGGSPWRAFEEGSVVGARYKIVRFIAHGGMGEVYEAEDLELAGRVALKTLRPDATADPKAVERFRQEISLARKVTHRNVCRIFDVGWHREAESGTGGIMFLTMEFLPGETLVEHLKRVGRMGPEAVLPLARQMGEALAAAHRVGVVHRDFKCANVMVVPTQDGLRAVVTDFGLARALAVDGAQTGVGQFVGTPLYMAPEQIEGGKVTPATDVYALGLVLYEMLTGRQPFEGDSPLTAAFKRLKEPPPPPRQLAPHLGAGWEALLMRCLALRPQDRFADAGQFLQALGAERGGPSRGSARGGRWARRALAGAAAVFAVAAVAAAVWYFARHRPAPPGGGARAPVTARRSVAVLGFKNLSGRPDAAWLSTALSEMLVTEMAAGDALRAIQGEKVSQMKMDLALSESDALGKESLARIRSNLGADYVVMGSYVALGEGASARIRVDLRLQDAAADETLALFAQEGTEARLFEIVSGAGAALRAKLGVPGVGAGEAAAVQQTLPESPEAARLYAEGLASLRLMEGAQALHLLKEAVAAEPSFPLAHAALSRAWSDLGYDGRAKDEALKAFDLSAGLPREGRLSVEGRYRGLAGEWPKAVECYRALWGFYPDDLDYGMELAGALTASGRGRDALATVEEMRHLPAPASGDPRIDIEEAEAAGTLGDWKLQAAAAAKASEKASVVGARLVKARARLIEARALRKLGDTPGARAAAVEAQGIYAAVGDREGAAHARSVMAFILYAQGDYGGAKSISQEALATYREIGNQSGIAMTLNSLGNVAYAQGDMKESARSYEECLAVLREIDNKVLSTKVASNLANALLLEGDLDGARKRQAEALALCRETGDASAEAYALCALGEIELDRGNAEDSHSRYEESLSAFRKAGEKSGEAYALLGMGDALAARGDPAGARDAYGQSLAIRETLGEKGSAAESRLSLASLAFDEGRAQEAAATAKAASEEFAREQTEDKQAQALALLTRALLARGLTSEALAAARQASSLMARNGNASVAYAVSIAECRARAAGGQAAAAQLTLQKIARDAGGRGFVLFDMEARLALGEVEMGAGQKADAQARLRALASEADQRGFALIARRARKAAGG